MQRQVLKVTPLNSRRYLPLFGGYSILLLFMLTVLAFPAWAAPYHPKTPIKICSEYPGAPFQRRVWNVVAGDSADGSYTLTFFTENKPVPVCNLKFSNELNKIEWQGTGKENISSSNGLLIIPGFPAPCDILPFNPDERSYELKSEAGGRTFIKKYRLVYRQIQPDEAINNGYVKEALTALQMISVIDENGNTVIMQVWEDGADWWVYEETTYRRSWKSGTPLVPPEGGPPFGGIKGGDIFNPPHSPRRGDTEYQAHNIPWSGYWWPYRFGGLATGKDYRGRPSPLEKYEMLTQGATGGPLMSCYIERYYDTEAPDWYGLCGAWALAACTENFDIFPSSENNIVFRVGDKKGLLTLAHTLDMTEVGDGSNPDTFHYWLLHYIKDHGKAFVADLDKSNQIWNHPIYRYKMESTINGTVESIFLIISYVSDSVHPDFVGTEEIRHTYTYNLFLGQHGEITGGQWTGSSVDDHPQQLMVSLSQGSFCDDLNYETVSYLAHAKDDFLEKPGESISINPGTYNLILMDEDRYKVDCVTGDILSIQIEKQRGSAEDIIMDVIDGMGQSVKNAIIGLDNPQRLIITAQNPPYEIRLLQSDYKDPNIYTLALDITKEFQQTVPHIPKSGMWSGFALTNPDLSASINILLTASNYDGRPVQTLLGPLNLKPGEKRLFFFADLPWRQHELVNIDSLRLIADQPVIFLNLFGYTESLLAGFVQGTSTGSHLIIPDTVAPMTLGQSMFGGVINESFTESNIELRLYSSSGILQYQTQKPIGSKEKIMIQPGTDPFFNMPASGWIEIKGNPADILSGYQILTASWKRIESIFALPVESSEKMIPHVAPPGYWITRVTIINPQDTTNQIIFQTHPPAPLSLEKRGGSWGGELIIDLKPKEKQVIEIQDQFGDAYYRFIVDVKGEYPFAGYVTYATVENKDEASLPLFDVSDIKPELILPHIAGTDYWWTGVGVCNPNQFEEWIRVEPYDISGNLMTDSIIYLWLAPGAYDVMFADALFPDKNVSFIKFCVEGNTGSIGGFYLYGNRKNGIVSTDMLAGAKM